MFRVNNGKLYIKKRTFPEWLVLLIFITPFVMSFFTEFLGLPGIIKFIPDLSLSIMVVMLIVRGFSKNRVYINRNLSPFAILVCVFFLYTLITYIFNFDSIFYYFWGVRNNFRFFIAFFAYAVYITDDFAESFLKFMDIAFAIHIVVTLFQFFILGYEQDFLGGVFGVTKGCNGYVLVFLSIISMKSILSFMNGTEKTFVCLLKCGGVLLNAALAELKAFYILFVIILILSSILTTFSWRKVVLISVSSVLLVAAYFILISLFDYFQGFLSLDSLWNSLTNESYSDDKTMNRLFSIITISRIFLTSFPEQLFGMGLGNCDVSSISIFSTAFYETNVDTFYSVFSIAFLFLETGYIGMILYLVFFVMTFVFPFILQRRSLGNSFYNQMAMVMTVICFFLFVYNSALRSEAGYLIYFVLALPIIGLNLKPEPQ